MEMTTCIPKIRAAMKRNGSPKARFTTDENRLWFLVEIPIHRQFKMQESGAVARQVEAQVEAQVELQKRQFDVLLACSDGETTGKALLAVAGYSSRTGNFKKGLQRLIDSHFLELTIPDKPNSRLQKYRLTAAGRRLLSSLKTDH